MIESTTGHRMLVTILPGDTVRYRSREGVVTAFAPQTCEVMVRRDDGFYWSWPMAKVVVIERTAASMKELRKVRRLATMELRRSKG
jgi:hypothetical protein